MGTAGKPAIALAPTSNSRFHPTAAAASACRRRLKPSGGSIGKSTSPCSWAALPTNRPPFPWRRAASQQRDISPLGSVVGSSRDTALGCWGKPALLQPRGSSQSIVPSHWGHRPGTPGADGLKFVCKGKTPDKEATRGHLPLIGDKHSYRIHDRAVPLYLRPRSCPQALLRTAEYAWPPSFPSLFYSVLPSHLLTVK